MKIIKKVLFAILLFTIFVQNLNMPIYADNITWKFENDENLYGTLTLKGHGDMDNYAPFVDCPGDVIPKWREQNSPERFAFYIIIEEGITSIGDAAFYGMYNITEVTLPEGITRIGVSAFGKCNYIDKINIPDSVTYIGEGAFKSSISNIEIYCNKDSYAHHWAVENGYRYKLIDQKEITSFTLNKTSLTLNEKESEKLIATIQPSNISINDIHWTSSNPDIASVDQNGNVTAHSEGKTTIYASIYGKTISCQVTVNFNFPFIDVSKKKWYYNYVVEAYKLGLMSGTDLENGIFSPETEMTRGMIVTVLYRIAGKPDVIYQGRFPDVSSKKYCAQPVEWAAKNKIVNGFKDGTFGPDMNITRQDVAVILHNYAKTLGLNLTNTKSISSYNDTNQVSSYATSALEWTTANGILTGTKEGNLNPKGNATRAECSKMLVEFYKLLY